MKNLGSYKITRQGQITLPSEARKELGLAEGDTVDIYSTDDLLVIKKRRTPLQVFEDLAKKTTERFKEKKISPQVVSEEIEAARKGP
jgi:AbrB family looped-hinge helix DNA binding protein